jgi:probable HAF family extracellular repeat protein
VAKAIRRMVCLICLLIAAESGLLAVTYRVTDLGASGSATWITGMNNLGQVIGVVGSYPAQRGFVWDARNGFRYLDTLQGHDTSVPQAVNDAGQIVGYADYSNACMWEEGKPVRDLGALPSGEFSPGARALDINEYGQVVGASTSNVGYDHAFFWSSGVQPEDLNTPNETVDTSANALNVDGIVVGRRGNNPFIWTGATGMCELGSFGRYSSSAIDINDTGVVLIDCNAAFAYNEGYVWDEATGPRGIGCLPGETNAYCKPLDLNNRGQVVGESNWQAFIWDATGGTHALPTIQGDLGSTASCINDYGLVAGWSVDSTGNRHFVLWEPVPEPSSLLALGMGLACLIPWRRRCRQGLSTSLCCPRCG